jgi:hypothetical protein
MHQPFQNIMTRQQTTEQTQSFRTNKTITNYNLSDFLPPTRDIGSQKIQAAPRSREKITTEPFDRHRETEHNELTRKTQLLEQEKTILKGELEDSKRNS